MSKETRKTQIIHLLANPSLSHHQIAKTAGVSTKTVQRVAKEIKPDVSQVDAKLQKYQKLLSKRLPIAKRVEIYNKIAHKADSNPFAAMRAVERADDLDGIVTARDRAKDHPAPAPPVAMFLLPSDSHVQVNIGCQQPPSRSTAIDVTPESSAPKPTQQ